MTFSYRTAAILLAGMPAALLAAALLTAAPARADHHGTGPGRTAEDTLAIVNAVQGLFDAMAHKDTALAERVMVREGRLFMVTETDGETRHVPYDNADFIDNLAEREVDMLERMWDPEVTIDGPIATLRAGYDFHSDGKFSHCGVDVFSLVRTNDGWKITGGIFTRFTEPCADNPLPPLAASPAS